MSIQEHRSTDQRSTDKRRLEPGLHPTAAPYSASTDSSSSASPSTPASASPARASASDEALVDRIRGGDRPAFDELYQRYFKRVYAFLDKRLRNRWDTEETTQEVFINVFASLDGYRGDAPFAAWIFGVTRRTLAARFRRKRHPMVPLIDEDEERSVASLTAAGQPEATPLENYEFNERANQIVRTLETEISDEQRSVFELHHLESVPIAEIARSLSKSEDSVKSNLYRTRKLLLTR